MLFAAPIAIAKHQLDHHDVAQSIEQCKLCAHKQPLDDGSLTLAQVRTLSIISFDVQTNELTTNLQQRQVNHFLSRAPPR